MADAVSPHPVRPGQICVTRTINPPVYQLPQGLSPGVRVKTMVYDYGFWTVMEIDRQEVRWRVFVILLVINENQIPRSILPTVAVSSRTRSRSSPSLMQNSAARMGPSPSGFEKSC